MTDKLLHLVSCLSKAHYLSSTQEKTKLYWEKKQQQFIIVPLRTIVHPCLDVMAVKDVHNIPKTICSIK